MSVRFDVAIDWRSSPRIITVAAPSTEITMQDISDTLRYLEHQGPNMVYDKILDSAGKENLGGGVTVGITLTLLNARLSFEMRPTPISAGAVTSNDAGTVLTDTAADFVSDGIVPGDTIMNYDDESTATVLSVSAQSLIHTQLGGGIQDDWDIGEGYAVYQTVQCNVSGGNLVAVDSIGGDLEPIFPTAFTQVVRTSSSSATLQELSSIQYSSFGGGVTVDTSGSYSGTEFPTGTPQQPVNNFADALSIAATRGITRFFILGDATVDNSLNFDGYTFVGESIIKSTITIAVNASVVGCEFYEATITGTLDGNCVLQDCLISDLLYVNGIIQQCLLGDSTITLAGSEEAHFIDCWSGVAGGGIPPTIDMGGSGQDLAVRNYNGGLLVINCSGAANCGCFDLNSGALILDSTITAGVFSVRGIGECANNTTGTATVDTEGLISKENISSAVWDEALADHSGVSGSAAEGLAFLLDMEGGRWLIDEATNEMVFYKADNVTEVARFGLKDIDGNAASEDVFERVRT